jgi:prepilin-type N-terminal cleavage/methylation domain-containing protein
MMSLMILIRESETMNYTNKKNAGFSMIEVLVASTILVVIVMMLAMLFQQTGMAWRTGVRRADSFMQVRSLIGAIQRDAAKAVDQRSIPQELRDKLGGGKQQKFDNSNLKFFTLSTSGFEDNSIKNGTPRRSLSFVEYETSGKRTETILLANGDPEVIQSDVMDFVERVGNKNAPQTNLDSFDREDGPDGSAGLPLSIRLNASVTSQGYNLEIGAASAGPDGAWDTDDDIVTWIK